MSLDPVASIKYRSGKLWKKLRDAYVKTTTGAEHVGRRSFGKRQFVDGHPAFRKKFLRTEDGINALTAELKVRDLFADKPWVTPILRRGDDWIDLPQFPEGCRLDRVAPTLPLKERRNVAHQAIHALFDMFCEGYAHRDLHGKNAFWYEGQLFIIDFEAVGMYRPGERPPFEQSYDLIGEGLPSPHRTGNISYTKVHAESFEKLLGIPLREVLQQLKQDLKNELHEASLSFQAKNRRHTCKAQKIYNSFSLPYLTIEPEVVQRRTHRRFENFAIQPIDLAGKSVLDIGSNIGGVLFELQKFGPGKCRGIEFDSSKVAVARRIAAYNGLNNVSFEQRNVDHTDGRDLGEQFDVVFCLAVIEHVERRQHLYQLLGEVTRGVLYFEGNASTNPEEVLASLRSSGFNDVRYLGLSDDDCLPSNNHRPIFRAVKGQ